MTATTAGSRPSSTRGGRGNKHRLAEDLGRRGEPAPSWLGDDPGYADAYERGVSARDRAAAGAPPKPRSASPSADASSSTSRPVAPRSKSSTAITDAQDYDRDMRARRGATLGALGGTAGRSVESMGDSLGSVIVGLVGYALLMNAIRGGWTGVKQWMSAKFTNGDGQLP